MRLNCIPAIGTSGSTVISILKVSPGETGEVWGEMLTVVAASAVADNAMPDVRDTMKRKNIV